MGLGLVREPVRRWLPPATVLFPKMQGHHQYRTLFLPALPLLKPRLRELTMALLLPNTVSLSQGNKNKKKHYDNHTKGTEHGSIMVMLTYCMCLFLCSSVEMKLQPEPSAVLSQLAQRQQSSILSTTEPLGMSQLHAPQVPTPPGRTAKHS